MHIEVLTALSTAASTGAAATAATGDSLTLRNGRAGSRVRLLSAWHTTQAAGSLKVVGPAFSDTSRGLYWPSISGGGLPLWPPDFGEAMYPQDTLAITHVGSATGGDIEHSSLLLFYEDTPGIAATLLDLNGLRSRGRRTVTVYATLSSGTAGGYSGSEAINAESDLLRPNTDYALLGGVNIVAAHAIGVKAPDWGNVRVAWPGATGIPHITNRWFAWLSEKSGLPCIPVFNSGNKAGIFLDCVQDENGADPIVGLNLVELA
jgi:hypothetical protein